MNGDKYALDFDVEFAGVAGVIRAAATGEVVDTETSRTCDGFGYGNYVGIRSTLPDSSTRYALYAHLASVSVSDGDIQYRGSRLGVEGNTGFTYNCGVHLHFRWTTTLNCSSQACAKLPEPMSDLAGFATGQTKWSDNRYVGTETAGVFRWAPLEWRLTDRHISPVTQHHFIYGSPGDKAVYGDWDDDGAGTIGTFRNYNPPFARWYLNDDLDSGPSQHQFDYGYFSDTPVAGNWLGDGSRPGTYRAEGNDGRWYINYDFDGSSALNFIYGLASDLPVTGDWDCDGDETIGVFRPGERKWYLNNDLDGGPSLNPRPIYGEAGDIPVAGDWNGDGCDSIGVFRPSDEKWYLNDNIDDGNSEHILSYGQYSDLPVVGDWNNDP